MWITVLKVCAVGLGTTPFIVTCVLLIGILYRAIVSVFLRMKYGDEVEFLEGPDVLFALDRNNDRMVILGYSMYKGQHNVEEFRKRIETNWLRLRNPDGSMRHKRLRQRLHHDMGYYFWLPNENFRIEDHIFLYEGGSKPKTDEEFNMVVTEISNKLFPADSSPWQFILVPLDENYSTLEPGPHYALVNRCLHGLCDGVSYIRMMSALFDEPYDQLPMIPKIYHSPLELILYGLQLVTIAPLLGLRDMLRREHHMLSKPGELTHKRLAGFTATISTERFKKLKNALGCTVNDVVMSCFTGALRAHFLAEGQPMPDYLNLFVPGSKHDLTKPARFYNYCNVTVYKCPLFAKTPLERIQATKKASVAFKKSPLMDFTFIFVFRILCAFYPVWMVLPLIDTYRVVGTASNVYGPQKKSLLLGLPHTRGSFLLPFRGNIGLGMSAFSCYNGLQFGLSIDIALMKEQAIVERFLKFITTEFEDLENLAATVIKH